MKSYITDTQLAEGMCGAIIWSVFWIHLRNRLELNVHIEAALAWILVWMTRKFGLTLYISIKKYYNIPDFKVMLLPYPHIK